MRYGRIVQFGEYSQVTSLCVIGSANFDQLCMMFWTEVDRLVFDGICGGVIYISLLVC